MRGKPLYGYATIGIVGILLMVVLSFVGVNEKNARLALEGEEGGQPAQETVDTTDPMALGEQAYKNSCIGCHGGNFDGPMASLVGLADKYTLEEVKQIIIDGIPGTSMPGGLIPSQEQVDALAEYLLEATK